MKIFFGVFLLDSHITKPFNTLSEIKMKAFGLFSSFFFFLLVKNLELVFLLKIYFSNSVSFNSAFVEIP